MHVHVEPVNADAERDGKTMLFATVPGTPLRGLDVRRYGSTAAPPTAHLAGARGFVRTAAGRIGGP